MTSTTPKEQAWTCPLTAAGSRMMLWLLHKTQCALLFATLLNRSAATTEFYWRWTLKTALFTSRLTSRNALGSWRRKIIYGKVMKKTLLQWLLNLLFQGWLFLPEADCLMTQQVCTSVLFLVGQSVWSPGHQHPHVHQQDDKTQSGSNLSPSWLSLTTHTVPLHKPHNSIDLGPSCDTVVFGRRPKQLHLWIWPQEK